MAVVSSKSCAATCMGVTWRSSSLSIFASRFKRASVSTAIGTFDRLVQRRLLGRPGRLPWPGSRRSRKVLAKIATPNAPAEYSGTVPTTVAPSFFAIESMPFAILFFLQGKPNLKVRSVNHETDRALRCFYAHAHQKFSQVGRLAINRIDAGIRLDDHRCVVNQVPAAFVIAPNPASLRESSCSTEQSSKDRQGFRYPILLINRLAKPVYAWNEQDEDRAFTLGRIKSFFPFCYVCLASCFWVQKSRWLSDVGRVEPFDGNYP